MNAELHLAAAVVLWPCFFPLSPLNAGEIATSSALAQTLALPDGSPVQLTGLLVDKVVCFPPYAVVRDGANPDDRLIVLLSAPPALRRWQTVDVEGVLTTLPNGYRALAKCELSAYTDPTGIPSLAPIPAAGFEHAWPFRLSVGLDTSVEAFASARSGQEMLDSEEGLPTPEPPEMEEPEPAIPAVGTIQWAKTRPDGTPVTLNGKIATRYFNLYLYDPFLYIQEPAPETAGMRVLAGDLHNPDDRVNVSGTLATTADGERAISYPTITLCETCQGGYMPLVMASRAVPCGPLHLDDQDPNTVDALGASGGIGAHHVGSALRLTGRITAVSLDPSFFYISDGGTTWNGNPLVTDETDAVGIRVEMPAGFPYWPAVVGDYATITGIAALRHPNSSYYPVLLLAANHADRVSHCGRLLTIDPIVFDECTPPGGETEVRVRYTVCEFPAAHVGVTITLSAGEVFDPVYETWIPGYGFAITDTEGYATFWLRSILPVTPAGDIVHASAADWGGSATAQRPFTHVHRHPQLTLTAVPYSVPPSQTTSTITATLIEASGAGIEGRQVDFTTTARGKSEHLLWDNRLGRQSDNNP